MAIPMVSCGRLTEDKLLEKALELAGENRAELEKVLERYGSDPADSLEYEAARFLIANMPYYYYYEGELLDNYMEYYSILNESMEKYETPDSAINAIKRKYGPFSYSALKKKYDIEEIDSAYLCHNIDWAFKVWREQPWGKNVSFEEFKEQILPYRIGDERPEYWREEYHDVFDKRFKEEYLALADSVDIEDPIQAAIFISKDLMGERVPRFTTAAPASLPSVGPKVAWNKSGSCKELSDFVVYACRAVGIPCAIDFMPIRENRYANHSWVSYKAKNGDLYYHEFLWGVHETRNSLIHTDPKLKVFRNTFGLDMEAYGKARKYRDKLLPKYRAPHVKDMTESYAKDFTPSLRIPESGINKGKMPRVVYLCGNAQREWLPLEWAEFNRNGLVFHDLDKGNILRVVGFGKNGEAVNVTDPFYVTKDHEIKFIRTSEERQDMTLYAKMPYSMEDFFRDRMLGGVFEGSDRADFRDSDTLHVITEPSMRLLKRIPVAGERKYKYFRYAPADTSFCILSELTVKDPEGNILKGKVIGTPNRKDGKVLDDIGRAFDGDTRTSFRSSFEPIGGWVGLEFDAPRRIGEITYTHVNYDNYVFPGDSYELFYCDGDWKSAGVMTAESDSLVFKDVPANSLYLLKDLSRGYDAAVFTYENGVQVWDN